MKGVGITLMIAGAFIVAAGLLFLLASRFPSLGHLPGDIHVQGKRWSFTFPLTTCVLVSIVLTLVLNIILRLTRK